MAEGEDKDSKTEEPTEKKIRMRSTRAMCPFSREVPVFASILGTLLFLVFFLPRRRKPICKLPARSFRAIR
jgi:flagellar biosynthetic protein FlhB